MSLRDLIVGFVTQNESDFYFLIYSLSKGRGGGGSFYHLSFFKMLRIKSEQYCYVRLGKGKTLSYENSPRMVIFL